jgi:predicted TIM-barrel fold metal-dependent hydrolase
MEVMPPMIDTHTHLGQLRVGNPGLRPSQLLRWMDRNGIEKAIVLAIENPEELDFFVTTKEIIRMTKPHGDRLFPLCVTEPRHRYPGSYDPLPIIQAHVEAGCVGFGENLCGLPVDDPMQQTVYAACNELRLPVLMHFDSWINRDRKGLPGFEKMLATFKNVDFIGHGPNFWREISKTFPPKVGYPKGPIVPGGRLDQLFKRYPNLYADLSAGSGHNAITRDPDFGFEFLQRWQDRLMFATDYLEVGQQTPIIEHIRTVGLPKRAFERIARKNAEKVFRLPR